MLVQQTILVTKDSHKGMVLGHGGQQLKNIGMRARKVMQEVLGEGVRLELRVKVEENWQQRGGVLKQLGLA
jgi:GTPase